MLGYAEILRNVLALKGIECRYVAGTEKDSNDAHAWNQVKIGEHWFNVDLTWDRDKIKEMTENGIEILPSQILHTDEEFINHDKYVRSESIVEERCSVGIQEVIETGKRQVAQGILNSVVDLVVQNGITTTDVNRFGGELGRVAAGRDSRTELRNIEKRER